MKKIQKIIYLAGVVLDNSNIRKLINYKMSNIYCHHMTIKYGNISYLPKELGLTFNFIADKVYFNDKAVAISGNIDSEIIKKIMKDCNQIPHITICTANEISPVYSNILLKIGHNFTYHNKISLKFRCFRQI